MTKQDTRGVRGTSRRRSVVFFSFVAGLLFVFAGLTSARGQTSQTLSGTVTDPSGRGDCPGDGFGLCEGRRFSALDLDERTRRVSVGGDRSRRVCCGSGGAGLVSFGYRIGLS